MKYTREYTCGHIGTVDIGGKVSDREWKLEREFDKHCNACRLSEFETHARENGLPLLTGYKENLILWGYEIRKSFFENKEKLTKEHIAEYNIVKEDDVRTFYSVVDEILQNRTTCTWWTLNKASATVKFIMSYYIEHVEMFKAKSESAKALSVSQTKEKEID